METISRDLHRQFPLHEMFVSPQGHGYEASGARGSQPHAPIMWCSPLSPTLPPSRTGRGGLGRGSKGWGGTPNGVSRHRQQGLLQVLKAYTLYRPEQGYCQAQGPVAAVLLMHLPPEVSALDPAPAPGTQDPDPAAHSPVPAQGTLHSRPRIDPRPYPSWDLVVLGPGPWTS